MDVEVSVPVEYQAGIMG